MSGAFTDLTDRQLAGRIGKRPTSTSAPAGRPKPASKAIRIANAEAAGEVTEPNAASRATHMPDAGETLTSGFPRLLSGPSDSNSAPDPIADAEQANRVEQSLELLSVVQQANPDLRAQSAEAAAYRLIGIDPRDTIEQMMATQMIALHAATMDCARRAAQPNAYDETRRQELNLAQKSSRAFTQLVDTLDRRRRGGEQKMTVEHVHVHAGGQAIVGNVTGADATGRKQKRK